MTSASYERSWLVDFFHSFPHVGLTFQRVNSSFNLDDAYYQESLLFWAAIPVLWLLLTLIVFLCYFCYRCCQQDIEKKRPVPCLVWTMSGFAIISLGVLGMGFYGNEVAKETRGQLLSAQKDALANINRISEECNKLEVKLSNEISADVDQLERVYNRYPGLNSSAKNELNALRVRLSDSAINIENEAKKIDSQVDQLSGSDVIENVATMELYRWMATLIFLIWMVVLCIILLIGIGLKSKCTLLVFCACGIFTMVVCWMFAGLYAAVALGTSDFCYAPNSYTMEKVFKDHENEDNTAIKYLLTCDKSSPFDESLLTIKENLHEAGHVATDLDNLHKARRITREEVTRPLSEISTGFDECEKMFEELMSATDCVMTKREYDRALKYICQYSIVGIAYVLLCLILCGFLFTLLVILASRAWKHFSRSRKQSATTDRPEVTMPKTYLDGDVDEPLMFPPRDENGSYYSFTRSGRQGPRDTGPPRRPTPPPAYNSYELRPHHASGATAPIVHDDDFYPSRYD